MDKSVIQVLIFSVLACTVIIGLAVLLESTSNVQPIRTAAEAEAFSNSLLGFECVGDNTTLKSTIPHDNIPDSHGYYGNKVSTIIDGKSLTVSYMSFLECRKITERDEQGREVRGTTVFSLMFNPNNHWIIQQTCDYMGYPEHCPKDEAGDYVWIGMRSTLNDPDTETYQGLK